MRKREPIFLFIIFLLLGCSSSSWEEVHSSEGQFYALFPGHPNEQILPLDSALGLVNMRILMVQDKKGAFGVGYARIPELAQLLNSSDVATIKGFFDATRDGMVENVGGVLISEKSISLGGYPGREVIVNVPHVAYPAVLTGRIYIVHDRYYQIQAVIPKGKASSHQIAQKFLASFRVTAY